MSLARVGNSRHGSRLGGSMDGRGRAADNIFTERLWRSVKYEEVYLNDYASPRGARYGLAGHFHFYNFERPHQALDYQTPAQGPTNLSVPDQFETVFLGSIKYTVQIYMDDQGKMKTAYYIDEKSISSFDYKIAFPVFWVQSKLVNWEQCRELAEEVLSTLHSTLIPTVNPNIHNPAPLPTVTPTR